MLGHDISGNGLRPQQAKLDVIKQWPTPTDVKQLWRFLGLANFRKFVTRYATKAALLEKLVHATAQGKNVFD